MAERFPIVFVQYHSWKRDPSEVREIRTLAANGSRVIVDFEFFKSTPERQGRTRAPKLPAIIADADWFLQQLEGVPLEAITIDEESDPSHLPLLGRVYTALKQRYPERTFLQWLAADANPAMLNLAQVPADGWVIDPYLLSPRDYTGYVATMRRVTDRIYSIVWASPDWQVGGGFRKKADRHWWNQQQWRVLYNRLAVNQANGVTSVFYLFGLEGQRPRVVWQGDSCSRGFYSTFTAKTLPYIERNRLPLAIPADRPAWMPSYC